MNVSAEQLLNEVQQYYAELVQAAADAEFWYERCKQDIEATYEQNVTQIHAEHDQAVLDAHDSYQRIIAAIDEVKAELGPIAAPWQQGAWESLLTSDEPTTTFPQWLRVGGLKPGTIVLPESEVPALVPLIGHNHLLITSQRSTRSQALDLMQSLVTRLVATCPLAHTRFVMIDPLGLGDHFPFGDLPEFLRGYAVYSEAEEIQLQMREVTEHIRQVTQKYLGRQHSNIESYNRFVDSAARVPYYFLCIADFPMRFEGDSLTRLLSIAEKGIRTGVHILAHINLDAQLPDGFRLDTLENSAHSIALNPESVVFSMGGELTEFIPDSVPDVQLYHTVLEKALQEMYAERPLAEWSDNSPQTTLNVTRGPRHVFISYSRKDSAMMQRLRDDLRERGLIVWTDEKLIAGTDDWQRSIEEAIRTAGALVVILSPDSQESVWVRRELHYAEMRRVKIFPVLVRGDDNVATLSLALTQRIDLRNVENYDEQFKKLAQSLEAYLAAQGTAGSSA